MITLAACQSTAAPTVAPVGRQTQTQTYPPVALWTWQENVITDASDEAAFFTFATSHGVKRVYIECEASIQKNQPALIAFLHKVASHQLTAELLFGDDEWVLPGSGYPHQGYAVSLVSTYAARLLSKMTTGRPVAVHFDVEPYALPQWKTKRNALAKDYVNLVTKLARAAHAIGLKVSVDVPYWYSNYSGEARPGHDPAQPASHPDRRRLRDHGLLGHRVPHGEPGNNRSHLRQRHRG